MLKFIGRVLSGKSSRLELLATAVAVTMLVGGAAYAASKISGKRLKNGSVAEKKLSKDVQSKLNKTAGGGAPGASGTNGTNATFQHTKWTVISRNSIGSGVAELVDGPFGRNTGDIAATVPPPRGTGSLLLETSNNANSLAPPQEKIAFGNETDFAGLKIANLNQVGFSVFTSGDTNGTKVPNIVMEINPDVTGATDSYSSMVYIPSPPSITAAGQWFTYDATTQGTWYLTGSEGTTTGCNQGTPCTFTALKANLATFNNGANAVDGAQVSLSVGVAKGRDDVWSGNVDALRINNSVYDFEADGVKTVTP